MVALDFPSTGGRVEFKWPQKVGRLLKVRTDGKDFVDQIFNADNILLTKSGFDNRIVRNCDAVLVNLCEPTFVYELLNGF